MHEVTNPEAIAKFSWQQFHSDLHPAVLRANDIFRAGFKNVVVLADKPGAVQDSTAALTQTDLDIDAFLKQEFARKFPGLGVITEETDEVKIAKRTIIVDPIDGTGNFKKGIPNCGISIAGWEEDNPQYGILSYPMHREEIYAIEGGGVYHNGKRLEKLRESSEGPRRLLLAHVGTEEEKSRVSHQLEREVGQTKDLYSTAYQLGQVALGNVDAAVFLNLPIWDIAAGMTIVKERGLTCTFIGNEPKVSVKNPKDHKYKLIVAHESLVEKIAHSIQAVL